MNIFKILSNGDGNINEPNISAFLGYMLDPNADHGLNFEFLDKFLRNIDRDINTRKYDYQVILEQAFKENNKKKQIVDIVIICFENNKGEKKESIVQNVISTKKKVNKIFLIENKIRGKETTDQLINQYSATIEELNKLNIKIKDEDVYSIYLTPDTPDFVNEFKSFNRSDDNKFHFKWKGDFDDDSTIQNILIKILKDEAVGKIDAINEYTKHTLKSFIQFIETDFKSEKQEEKERRNDGTYTNQFIVLNKRSNIEDRLNYLSEKLKEKDDKLIISKANLKDVRHPFIFVKCKKIVIKISVAGSKNRDDIYLTYHIDNDNKVQSKLALTNVADSLNITVKVPDGNSYCRTKKMQGKIKIESINEIYNALIDSINNIKNII